ncbi:CRISPR system precrRNA processing endoribonuclease RAMP protein Cas6 [Vibrio sp. DNB22_12_1]
MTQSVLIQLANHFPVLKLHITVRLNRSARFPAFKGSMLHGWFGQVVKNYDGRLYHILFGVHDNRQPKPYVICPSGDHKQEWQQGELFSFELSLFGEAVQCGESVVDAITTAATHKHLGLGKHNVPFELLSVASVTPYGLRPNIIVSQLGEWLTTLPQASITEQECSLLFETPVRVKYQGKVCHHAVPHLDFWCTQIMRRLTGLSRFWVVEDDALFDAMYIEAHKALTGTQQVAEHCYWEDWQRFSFKHQSHLPFGGIKGQLSFYGEVYGIVPLLKVGELLHIGGKTTFGLGKYQLIV